VRKRASHFARRLRSPRRQGQAGFTLIELMISLVMFSFAIAGVLAVAVAMAAGFREQKQAVSAEGTSRAAMEFLTDAIRGASPGVMNGNDSTIENVYSCAKGAFSVSDNTGVGSSDTLRVVFAYGSVVTYSRSTYSSAGASIDVVDGSQFAPGDLLLISNMAQGHILEVAPGSTAATLQIKNTGWCTLGVAFPGAGSYPAGSLIVRVMQATFSIAALDGIPTLFMSDGTVNEPLAEGIEDMQFELGVDLDNNNVLTDPLGVVANDDEWLYNFAGEAAPATTALIRGVKVTLVARTTGQVTGVGSYTRPKAGNHAASLAPDNYRRRLLSTVVEVRNVGGSP
jgi:type II secretory pathway pseudopilin PulG